jgi:acetate kinase
MTAPLGSLDALAFTAVIGEHAALVRERLCERLHFLGIEIDRRRNTTTEPDRDNAAARSRVRVLVVRAREELVIVGAVRALIASTTSEPTQLGFLS